MRKILIFLLLIPILLLGSGKLRAQTIALLPLADTAIDYNGVDLVLTDSLHQLLTDAGLTLLDDASVRRFMAANRLRHSGSIDSFAVKKIGRELAADIVLIATLCENGPPEKERFGVILTAFETVNGSLAWSYQASSSLYQETTLLGVGAPRDGIELKSLMLMQVAEQAAAELPEIVPERPSGGHQFKLVDLKIFPAYVRGNSPVECQVKLESLNGMPTRIILSSGEDKLELLSGKSVGDYHGHWQAPAADGVYSVSLDIFSGADTVPLALHNYASYTVINQAPQLSIEMKQGFTLNGVTIFHEQLLVTATLRPNRAVSHWQVKVTRADGTVVVDDQVDGELPRDLIWRGCNNKHQRLPDGEYIFTMIIWDAAGNRAAVSRRVAIKSECQPVEAQAVRQGEQNYVRLNTPEGSSGLLGLQWKLQVLLPDGDLLMEHSGSSLPVEFALPDDMDVDFLLFSIDVRDQIGNTFSVVDSRLQLPESGVRLVKTEKWSNDF